MIITITLNAAGLEDDDIEISIIGECVDNYILWQSALPTELSNDYAIGFRTDLEYKDIKELSIGKGILSQKNEIKDSIIESLLNYKINLETSTAYGIDYDDEHSNNDNTQYDETPYDPKRIRVDSKPLSIEYVVKIINSGKLDISPAFQREFVWTDGKRKSRLIESIMLRIPLPVFYLSQDSNGDYKVIDGLQRLTVIYQFVNNKFRLSNLEYLSDELNGKWFSNDKKKSGDNIPSLYRDRILETQLYFNIIDPATPNQVKYDIFRRINTGGKQLNPQEIRNCLSSEATRDLLKEMVSLESFEKATRKSISPTRMADKELALRFASFYMIDSGMISDKYKGGMGEFLDAMNNILNERTKEDRNRILNAFNCAMTNAYLLFGGDSFRKASYINKALFLSWSRVLWKYNEQQIAYALTRLSMKDKLRREIENNDEYSNAISSATNDVVNIEQAYNTAKRLLEESINYDSKN